MEAGDTFKFKGLPHLWVVVSDPMLDPHQVLVINMSTDRGIDDSCILIPGDHLFVRHRTCMRYDRAMTRRNADLEELLSGGQIILDERVSAPVLRRIRQGAAISDYIKIGYKQLLVRQSLIEP